MNLGSSFLSENNLPETIPGSEDERVIDGDYAIVTNPTFVLRLEPIIGEIAAGINTLSFNGQSYSISVVSSDSVSSICTKIIEALGDLQGYSVPQGQTTAVIIMKIDWTLFMTASMNWRDTCLMFSTR